MDHFADKDGNKNAEFPSTMVRTAFLENDGKTTVRSTAKYNSAEELQKVLEMGMEGGIAETFDKLEEFPADPGALFQPFQHTFSFHYILVIPLYFFGFFQPTP